MHGVHAHRLLKTLSRVADTVIVNRTTMTKGKIMQKKDFLLCSLAGLLLATSSVSFADGPAPVPFPEGYRTWYNNNMQVNHTGFSPESQLGIHATYANELALEGLKTGKYADGATFVLDRFEFVDGEDHTIKPGKRKLVGVMVKDAANHPETGGWAFEGFKGGDRGQRVVKDNGKACFTCHAPFPHQDFIIQKLRE